MRAAIHGRDDERSTVVERLRSRRLVTLVGPGGIGKTALAHVAAAELAPDFAMGYVPIDLTRVDRPDAVFEAIAGQLGYADFRSLIDSPSDQPALLVVDNCEHVLDAAADAIDQMLAACQMPTVLATSRVPLDLAGESIVSVGPLRTPDSTAIDVDAPAMDLLLERMRDQGVDVDIADPAELAEVCRRLDGVPLALELAAARLRVVSPAELLRELDVRPHALARRRFRGQASHRSVAEVVGWSTDLLTPEVRTVFERLGVFAGPFTAETASEVIGEDVAIALSELVDASLVQVEAVDPAAQYRLLHPVRAVAVESLRTSGALHDVSERLADHVVAQAVDIIVRASAQWNADALPELMRWYDHIAATLRWLIDHDDRPDRALTLTAVLWGLVHQAHTAEISVLGEAALERWDAIDSPLWPDAVATVVTCRSLRQRYDDAIELAERTLPIADRSQYAPATLRRALAQTHRVLGNTERSLELFAEGAALAARAGARGLAFELEVDVGMVEAERGRAERGLAVVDAALAAASEVGAEVNEAWAMAGRAHVLLSLDTTAASDAARAALDRSVAIDYPIGRSCSLRVLARAQLAAGDLSGAAGSLDRMLDELLARGGLNDLRSVLDVAAAVVAAADDDRWRDLAATAASLPVTTVMVPIEPLVVGDGEVLAVRDAYVLARRSLRDVAAGAVASAPVASESPDGAGRRDGATIADLGDTVMLTWQGRSISVRMSKGIRDLWYLLLHPDRDVSCLDLMDAGVVSSAGETELLDATARRRYESRILELQADIERAEDDHDLGTLERLQIEMDALVDQLTSATGLGGRSRTSAAPIERARSAVTQRIRSTIKRITELDAPLGRHLDASITTGQFCSYRPVEDTRWTDATADR